MAVFTIKVKGRENKKLLYYFPFLPAQVLAFAFSAFKCSFCIACTAISADFHV
jgi:hypothetical protein